MPSIGDMHTILNHMTRVGGHVLREKLRRPQPRVPSDVPASAADVNPAWLTAVLCQGHPQAKVESVALTGGSTGTSSRQGLRVSYNAAGQEAGLPTRLFSKATSQYTQRLVLGLAGVLPGEPGFYGQIRPGLDIEAPRGYYGAHCPDSWRSFVLMEDIVASKNVTFCDPKTHIGREQIEDLLANMANWHGALWNSPRFAGDLAWLRSPQQFGAGIDALIGMQKRSLIGARRAAQVIPEALLPRQPELYAALQKSLALLSRGDTTLLHGDSHVGQTYQTQDGRMGFGDWQIVQRGGWGYDYAYTLATSLTVDDRRRWEEPLLKFYLNELARRGGPRLDFDTAWLTYRQSLIYPYFAWVYTIGAGALQPNMQPRDICLLNIERTAAAIQDLGAIEAVAGADI